MDNFKNLTEKFAYKENENTVIRPVSLRTSPRKKVANSSLPHKIQKKTSSYKYHKSELLYKHLDPLPDLLDYNLKLVFCGFNPGIKSAEIGHRYGHKSNDFWKIIHEAGIVDTKLTPEDDESMPKRFRIGFTELVMRPTKNIEEIPAIEMQHNVPRLINTINTYKPKVLCLVGRGIWDSISKHTNNSKTKKFTWGLQDQKIFNCKCFVVPSTSGLVTIPRIKKLEYWNDLKKLVEESDK
ncbi:hypothetical protein BN7_3680 [Wickerhamomyces ciferrii]|uniref:Uracil-DNA glycosylase-like domain-containing protein n=1 Tax=Wickerhamomyces ciferrii (strain ATCC 14091 / BCRC 22168 / CBS 111 / JCM 3599 / NBRC 0793 / NRRL Y-1031 F-60-10) TaxID=1206466 RepID=K0KPN1_WICCF|nr:uncharacterized protein BN7_3680 [Wickerhamomyces ciferrii]CCH44122.1 hypothetical protein BN7_3680 [Wickerhamomyces ciferrii]